MEFIASGAWREAYPGAVAAALAMSDVFNPPEHPAIEGRVREVEAELRSRFAGATRADIASLPELLAYAAHYRQFGKTYHVQLQLESVALKGRPLRSAGALVTAMFAAELRSLLLTAGHDLDAVEGPVRVDVSKVEERYVSLGGREVVLKPGDMLMRDAAGIISSILSGPDHRTRLRGGTRRALFTVYAPAGIGAAAVRSHLEEIAANVRLITPGATTIALELLTA